MILMIGMITMILLHFNHTNHKDHSLPPIQFSLIHLCNNPSNYIH